MKDFTGTIVQDAGEVWRPTPFPPHAAGILPGIRPPMKDGSPDWQTVLVARGAARLSRAVPGWEYSIVIAPQWGALDQVRAIVDRTYMRDWSSVNLINHGFACAPRARGDLERLWRQEVLTRWMA